MRLLLAAFGTIAFAGCGHMDRWEDGPVNAYRGIEHTWKIREAVNEYSGNTIGVEAFYDVRNTTREPVCAVLVFSEEREKKYNIPGEVIVHLNPGQSTTALTTWAAEDGNIYNWPVASGVLVMEPSAKGQCDDKISVWVYEQLLEQRD